VAIVWIVTHQNLGESFNGVSPSHDFEGAGRTGVGTIAAAFASVTMDASDEVQIDGTGATCLSTLTTADTLPDPEHNLSIRILCFRILTKRATGRAALKEHHAADTRAVLKTVPPDIHHQRFVVLLGHLSHAKIMSKVPDRVIDTKSVD
jgi:hypothetical protein